MSPRTAQQYEGIREVKKALIMNVALEHFAREGYHNTTISHIARHAGISKGLMYNYFISKEELLAEIIDKSVKEIYLYFDTNRDGVLTEDEFELFIRKLFQLLKEKRSFWRLFFQLMVQKDVMESYSERYYGKMVTINPLSSSEPVPPISGILKVFSEYFVRRKPHRPAGYDPIVDMNLCINTLKGFALTSVYGEDMDEELYKKTINRIIEIYK